MTKQEKLIKKLVMALADEVVFSSKWDISEASVELLNQEEALKILEDSQELQEIRNDLIKVGVKITKK